ncbi:MAG: hypothetical protein GY795_02700 [Desulfobacterales bacterium]|nr:hypothetical protein [Desulfobacterales bacterium]
MKFWQCVPKFHFGTPMQVPLCCQQQTPQETDTCGVVGFSSVHTRSHYRGGTPFMLCL